MSESLPLYQVDAFAARRFEGNPAAVVPLARWLPDETLQAIAAENNLSETAFFVATPEGEADYALRWLTPQAEVDLCGHATLATAWVLFERLGFSGEVLRFSSRSGVLTVARAGELLVLDLPARPPQSLKDPALRARVAEALGAAPLDLLAAGKGLAVFAREEEVAGLRPDMAAVLGLPFQGVIASAPGRAHDFVSRYFAPHVGVPEDPVTGAAHCVLTPYWAAQLGRSELRARQISARGGDVTCALAGERVRLGGRCALYLEGSIAV